MIRWYLKRASLGPGFLLIVERVSDRRGYRLQVTDRHSARDHLPGLRALVEQIDAPAPVVKTFDPTTEWMIGGPREAMGGGPA